MTPEEKQQYENHRHTGVDTPKIRYSDVIDAPTSTSPGGSTTQLQYNNAGAFGGISGATTDGSTLTVEDANFEIVDDGDTTKKVKFQASGITTATTRTVTLPDASGTATLLGNASTGSGSVVLATSPTIVTPVIASFTSAQHDHSNGSQGGQLSATNVFNAGTMPTARLGSGSATSSTFLRGDQTWATPSSSGFASRVRVYLGSDQAVVTGAGYTKIQFNTEDFDGDSEFDSATNYRFTAASAGYYMVTCRVEINRAGNTVDDNIYLYKNGSAFQPLAYYVQRSSTGGYNPFAIFTDIISLSASDYVEIFAIHGSGGSQNYISGPTHSYLSIHRLS